MRDANENKVVDYLDGFQIEARDSRTLKQRRSHKTNNSEQNHYYPFGLKHEVYVSADKKEFDFSTRQKFIIN